MLIVDDQDPDREPLPVDAARWTALATAVLTDLHIADGAELAIAFVDESAMAELNNRFMGHDGPTDVLCFPLDDMSSARDAADLPRLLGDIVICPSVAARNAPEHAGSYEDEIALLIVHGVLHVLGMDHAVDNDRVAMQHRERELLTAHHGAAGTRPVELSVQPASRSPSPVPTSR